MHDEWPKNFDEYLRGSFLYMKAAARFGGRGAGWKCEVSRDSLFS